MTGFMQGGQTKGLSIEFTDSVMHEYDLSSAVSYTGDGLYLYDIGTEGVNLMIGNSISNNDKDPSFVGSVGDAASYADFDNPTQEFISANAPNGEFWTQIHKGNVDWFSSFIFFQPYPLSKIETVWATRGTSGNSYGVRFLVKNSTHLGQLTVHAPGGNCSTGYVLPLRLNGWNHVITKYDSDSDTLRITINNGDDIVFSNFIGSNAGSDELGTNARLVIGNLAYSNNNDFTGRFASLIIDGDISHNNSQVIAYHEAKHGGNANGRQYSDLGYINLWGQSLLRRLQDLDGGIAQDYFTDVLQSYKPSLLVNNGAYGGAGLTYSANNSAYFYDDRDGSRGNKYDDEFDLSFSFQDAFVQIGNTDASHGTSEADFIAAHLAVLGFFDDDCPSYRMSLCNPLHRYYGSTDNTQWQEIKDAERWMEENEYFKLGAEILDLPTSDDTHLVSGVTGTLIQADRMAKRWLAERGYISSVGTIGMRMSNLSIDGASVTLTLLHDGGDDFTIHSGLLANPELLFRFEDSSGYVEITDIEKTSSNTLELTLASSYSGSDGKLIYGYGACASVDKDDPECIYDNNEIELSGDYTGNYYYLPLRQNTILAS